MVANNKTEEASENGQLCALLYHRTTLVRAA